MLLRNPKAVLIAASLLMAAGCSTSATPLAGSDAKTTPATEAQSASPTEETPTVADLPSDSAVPTPVPTTPPPPAPPTDFTATSRDGTVPCPSPDIETGDTCMEIDLSWTSTSPGSWFRIYASWTGEGPFTCTDPEMLDQAKPILETDPDVSGASLFNAVATGGGAECLWITAVSDAGESSPVAATGQ
jgi:hypothetical protein